MALLGTAKDKGRLRAMPTKPLRPRCRPHLVSLFLLLSAISLVGIFAASAEQSGGKSSLDPFATLIAAAIEEVVQGEEDGPALQALMEKLPQDIDGSFIVEGDLGLNRHELIDHLANLAPGVDMPEDNSELLLATVGGLNSIYSSKADRRLTYAIDKASFVSEERYLEMVTLMDDAAGDWESICAACFIEFIHVPEVDVGPDLEPGTTAVNFVVRFRSTGLFQARAFYPHDNGADRVLEIFPTFYTSRYPRVGILRHEIGHILGYRHEQLRGIPGCGAAGSDFVALTGYDNRSIMHYFCGEDGNVGGNPEMVLSESDIQGHRLIYQIAAQ